MKKQLRILFSTMLIALVANNTFGVQGLPVEDEPRASYLWLGVGALSTGAGFIANIISEKKSEPINNVVYSAEVMKKYSSETLIKKASPFYRVSKIFNGIALCSLALHIPA